MIVEELIARAVTLTGTKTVADVRFGLGTTAVLLSDGACGLSFTMRPGNIGHCHVLDNAGSLAGREAREYTAWAMDTHPVRSSVGIAVLNALFSPAVAGFSRENAMDAIDIRPGDTLGMVGHFGPVIRKHGHRIAKLYVFEREAPGENVYPDWAEDIYLPHCDVVIITGTTLINKTIDHVLSLCTSAREIVLMGASTCLCPAVFRAHGVHLIAGTRVTDAARAMQVVSEGGGTPDLRGCTEHLCIRM